MAADDARPAYDSFVVRMWHHPSGGSVLRVEVEHVQSGSVDVGRGQSWDWIRDRLSVPTRTERDEDTVDTA